MLELSVEGIVAATGAEQLVVSPAVASRVVIDSREATPETLFVAFSGERVDGNAFVARAFEAGCACACVTAAPEPATVELARSLGRGLVRADGDDGEEFLLRLAGAWRAENPQWLVIGVTGSVGKTTTKDMLAAGLSASMRVHATAGNHNNLIGVPLTLLSAPAKAEAVVVEMGINSAVEMPRLAACARPNVAVITNIGTSHIGLLGSREAIAHAKAEIVSGMAPTAEAPASCVVLAADNDLGSLIEREHARPAGVEVVRVGTAGSLAWAEGVALGADGMAGFELRFSDGWRRHVRLPVPGLHVVDDFLLAMAATRAAGADRAAAADAIAAMPQTHMRLELVELAGRPLIIDDSYNASPNSVAAALDVLCARPCAGRRVAVLGEIGELGGESARLHGYVGAYAAAKPLDLLVLVGATDIAHVAEAAVTMGLPAARIRRYASALEAGRALAGELCADDVVLAKGSRAAGLDVFVKEVCSHAG